MPQAANLFAMWRKRFALILVILAAMSTVGSGAIGRSPGVGNGLESVAEVNYPDGMHLLVHRSGGRDYLFTSSSYSTGSGTIRVFDTTNPATPKLVTTIPCGGNQAVMTLSHDKTTLIVAEGASHPAVDPCFPSGSKGFYTIDISNPRKPKPIGAAIIPRGGHHITAHPTKPFVYVAHGIIPALPADIQVFDVWSIKDPAKPKYVTTGSVTGYHGPHDIAFNSDGSYAVASSMTALQVLDTSDPANPKEIAVMQCPGCSHNHEAHFTPDDKHVVVSDEFGGGMPGPCPLGALYFYEWDPETSPYMDLIGEWQPAEFVTPEGQRTNAGTCTSHVFDISADGTKIAASWHAAGVRVVDITTMAGVGLGPHGNGAKEIGWYVEEGADAWSAKFDRTGKYVFVNDRVDGLQVYKIQSKS
jgi:hypothetical protein